MADTGVGRRGEDAPILEARRLSKKLARGGVFDRRPVVALDGVDLKLLPRRTLALLGPSGSGKTTLGRCLALVDEPTSGTVLYRGRPVDELTPAARRRLRPRIQLLMQDADAALGAGFSVFEALAEPLVVRRLPPPEHRSRVVFAMAAVGLAEELAMSPAAALSGGQKRRLLLARALLAEPEVLILDEALSGLDLSLQAQTVNLLLDLQRRFDLAYLVIAHDLAVAAYLADDVAVLRDGRVVERAPVHTWLERAPLVREPLAREPLGGREGA